MGCIRSKLVLTEEDLDFLKAHTHYDEETIKEWHKGFKQDCPNGNLTAVKFVEIYQMFFPSGNAGQFCDHVFRSFDTDESGTIDFKEFLMAIDVTTAGTAEEKLKWTFRMYDVDGNGGGIDHSHGIGETKNVFSKPHWAYTPLAVSSV